MKKLLVLFVLLTILFLALPGGTARAEDDSLTVHENPETAEVIYDGVAILDYYSRLLDSVLARQPAEVELWREKAPYVNIPQGVEKPLQDSGSSSASISSLNSEIEQGLDNMTLLVNQFRLEEMEDQRQKTQDNLTQSYQELSIIEKSIATIGKQLGVPSGGDSPLRRAYEEVEDRVDKLRRLVGLFQGMLTGQPGATIRQLQTVLRPTEITLVVEYPTAFVGDWVSFRGILSSRGAALPYRDVVLLLDGIPYAISGTGPGGSYQGELQVRYNYVHHMTLQALYYPRGEDIGVYLAAKSPAVELETLFYTAKLELRARGKSYPGLDTILYGRFDYGEQPRPAARQIQIYLDKTRVAGVSVEDSFEQKISLGPDVSLGEHRLLVVVPAQRRYAPVSAETTLNVVKAVPIIEIRPPKLAIMPLALPVRGSVYSELGPLVSAAVEIGFGSRQTPAITSEDGTLDVRVGTGMSFSFIGSQVLSLKVNPKEPWNSVASSSWSIVTINPILIGSIGLALGFVSLALGRRLRLRLTRPAFRRARQGILATQSATENIKATLTSPILPSQEEEKDPKARIIGLYTRLLRRIERITRVALKPQQTLREFAQECAPHLGPAHRYLEQFTRLIERLLYSSHVPAPDDVEKSQELGRLVEESVKR